jgi:hypothetical protein
VGHARITADEALCVGGEAIAAAGPQAHVFASAPSVTRAVRANHGCIQPKTAPGGRRAALAGPACIDGARCLVLAVAAVGAAASRARLSRLNSSGGKSWPHREQRLDVRGCGLERGIAPTTDANGSHSHWLTQGRCGRGVQQARGSPNGLRIRRWEHTTVGHEARESVHVERP